MAKHVDTVELRDFPDDFAAKYFAYEPTLRQKQRANAFYKGSYFHSLKKFKDASKNIYLSGKIHRRMRKSDPLHQVNIDIN